MVFRRFFERRPTEAERPERLDDDRDLSDDEDADDAAPEEVEELPPPDHARRARAVLPTGASTGSKRPAALYGREDSQGPTHFVSAHGCRLVTAEGRELIDCTMALGAVALGYAEPRITAAVVDAAGQGHVAGLSPLIEIDVAERLCEVVPCAEQVQFLKSGAEAVSAAVRVARAHTGRELVIGSGYFGWHDWATDAVGVPQGTRAAFRSVPFDDVDALERAVREAGSRLAAIVLEPVVERLPSERWASRARELCDRHDAVLVFDEMKTGFRLRPGGYQELSGVTPDLAAFGKAMANGWPLAAVVGRESIMSAARRTWISSTLASEAVSLAAANAVLDWHAEADVCDAIWSAGREMRERVDAAIAASGVRGVRTEGIDPMWLLRFDEPAVETRFLELAADEGVLFKRGAYNYASVAHDEEALLEIERCASAALVALRDEVGG
jgi:glutamate-1-semialdehyde aminotransferase